MLTHFLQGTATICWHCLWLMRRNGSFNYPPKSKQRKENTYWWKSIWELCGSFCPSCCYCLIVFLSFCCNLKGAPNPRSIVDPISRNAQNTHCSFSLDFHSYPVCWELMFERCKSVTVSAAVVCLAFCTTDIVNKAGIGGKSIKYVTSWPFLLLIGKEWIDMAAPWGAPFPSKKEIHLYKILIKQKVKHVNEQFPT